MEIRFDGFAEVSYKTIRKHPQSESKFELNQITATLLTMDLVNNPHVHTEMQTAVNVKQLYTHVA